MLTSASPPPGAHSSNTNIICSRLDLLHTQLVTSLKEEGLLFSWRERARKLAEGVSNAPDVKRKRASQ